MSGTYTVNLRFIYYYLFIRLQGHRFPFIDKIKAPEANTSGAFILYINFTMGLVCYLNRFLYF